MSAIQTGAGEDFDCIIICSNNSRGEPTVSSNKKILNIPCGEGKNGSRQLRSQLATAMAFYVAATALSMPTSPLSPSSPKMQSAVFEHAQNSEQARSQRQAREQEHGIGKTLVVCESGNDLSVGVALSLLCLHFDDEGKRTADQNRGVDKKMVRKRLGWIVTSKTGSNPSRSTLQAVNSFLMQRPL
jgi:Rit1 DUSP-like domain